MIKCVETTAYELKSIKLSRLEMIALLAQVCGTEMTFMFDQLDTDEVKDPRAFDKRMDMFTEIQTAVLNGYTEASDNESVMSNSLYVKCGENRRSYRVFFDLHHDKVTMSVFELDYEDADAIDDNTPIYTYDFEIDALDSEGLLEYVD